jgi:uncharacterized protein YcnI
VTLALGALALAPAAAAHVTVSPTQAEPERAALLTFSVPNERPDTVVTGLVVSMPPAVTVLQIQAKAGWQESIGRRTVSWRGGRIPPRRFDTFTVRAAMPARAGPVVFSSLEIYATGHNPTWRPTVEVAAGARSADAKSRDSGARTLGKAALLVAIAAAAIAVGAGFLALWTWLRGTGT